MLGYRCASATEHAFTTPCCDLGRHIDGGHSASLPRCLLAANGAAIGPGDLYDLPAADVVILGEVHDNPVHHAHQAIAVGALGAKALVFEMLTEAQALAIRPETRDQPGKLAEALGWEASGWPDFDMYYPIFVAAGDAPIFGGALDRAAVRASVSEGAAGVFGAGADLFGLTAPLPPAEQAAREDLQANAHCGALPETLLPGMVEAQRLRDAALARAVIAAFAETGGPVAVITGNGHARTDWGLPRVLSLAAPDLSVLSVGQFEITADPALPVDLWLVTDSVQRDDPCAGLLAR